MAEVAAAASAAGLASLGIQCCKGLTTYYNSYQAYDEQTGAIFEQIQILTALFEELERLLSRYTANPAQVSGLQLVDRILNLCRGRLQKLESVLQKCQSIALPNSKLASLRKIKSQALFPFREQTLISLRENVQSLGGDLRSALIILQTGLGMEQTQSITSLAASSRNVEIASRNTRSDIQAIAMPLLRTSTFFPLLPPPFLLFLLLFNQLEKPTSPSPPTYATFRPTITRWPSPDFPDCHVCKRMAETKVHYQVGDCARCLLCDRPYCKRHKGEEVDVCEINHMTYYRRHHTPGRIFPSMDARKYWGRVKGLDGGRDRGV